MRIGGREDIRVNCFLIADLHGVAARYTSLIRAIESEKPDAVFLAGDILPHGLAHAAMLRQTPDDFIGEFLAGQFRKLRDKMSESYPRVFVILGNDDARVEESGLIKHENEGLWEYFHARRGQLGEFVVYGYACVPPTPFLIKDWERYDVSRHLEPGDISPEEGWRSVSVPPNEIRYGTIRKDLDELTGDDDLSRAICLFHAPPYKTNLDRAALDGKMVDHAPLDVHVGSTAIRQFIEERQPLITLHGHIHESARIMGDWRDRIGRTYMFTGAHDGPQLSLVRFNPEHPGEAARELI